MRKKGRVYYECITAREMRRAGCGNFITMVGGGGSGWGRIKLYEFLNNISPDVGMSPHELSCFRILARGLGDNRAEQETPGKIDGPVYDLCCCTLNMYRIYFANSFLWWFSLNTYQFKSFYHL